MTPFEAAKRAFEKCRSKSNEKNRGCAPFIAKIWTGGEGAEEIEGLLKSWYDSKERNPDFAPPTSPEPPKKQQKEDHDA